MDSAGGNTEFTGFLLYFTSCFYLPLFHSLLASIGSLDQSLTRKDLSFFFFSCFVRLVWSLHFFSFGSVGVLHIKPVFLFFCFVICFFLNPSILVLG